MIHELYRIRSALWILFFIVLGSTGAARAEVSPEATLESFEAQRLYEQIQQWVLRGEVEAVGVSSFTSTPVLGVYVTLREHGIVLGTGQGLDGDLFTAGAAATRQALRSVRERLASIQAQDRSPTSLPWQEIGPRLLLDVQIGHEPRAIERLDDEPVGWIFARFVPGFHGLELRRPGDPQVAHLWPGQVLAANLQPLSQIAALLSSQGLNPQALEQVATLHGPILRRFRVWHMVRPQPGYPPLHLVRGGVPIPLATIDQARLDAMSHAMAQHLIGRITSDGLLRGTYRPTSDSFAPELATAEEAALTALALLHHYRAGPPDTAQAAHHAAVRILGRLHPVAPDPTQGLSVATMALMLSCELILGPDDWDEIRMQAYIERLLQAVSTTLGDSQGDAQDDVQEPALPLGSQILAAFALSFVMDRLPHEQTAPWAPTVGLLLDTLWLKMPQQPTLAMVTWLMPAYYKAAPALLAGGADPGWWDERRAMMHEVFERLIERQVTRPPAMGPADVLGGFQLSDLPFDAPPAPNWHTAQVLLALSFVLREDGQLAGPVRDRWLMAGQWAARFLDELRFKPANGYYVRNLEASLGGLRQSLYDNEMSPSASALGLLAIDQLRRTVARMEQDAGLQD